MELIKELALILLSLSGVLGGLVLAWIAPEELSSGKKYFDWVKRLLFIIILFAADFYFFSWGNLPLALSFSFIALGIFFASFKVKLAAFEIAPYLLFFSAFFLNESVEFRLLLSSLVFLYGLPLGSLFWMKEG